MAVDHRITRTSENFKGLDLRSSDIIRGQDFATDMRNAAYRISGAINKRKGFVHKRSAGSVKGMTTFKNISSNGSVTDELIYVEDNNVKKEVQFDLVAYRSQNITNNPVTVNVSKTETNVNVQVSDGSDEVYYTKSFSNTDGIFNLVDHIQYRTTFPAGSAEFIIDYDQIDMSEARLTWHRTYFLPSHFDSTRFQNNVHDETLTASQTARIKMYIPLGNDLTQLNNYIAATGVHEDDGFVTNPASPYSLTYKNDLLKFGGRNLIQGFGQGTNSAVYNQNTGTGWTSADGFEILRGHFNTDQIFVLEGSGDETPSAVKNWIVFNIYPYFSNLDPDPTGTWYSTGLSSSTPGDVSIYKGPSQLITTIKEMRDYRLDIYSQNEIYNENCFKQVFLLGIQAYDVFGADGLNTLTVTQFTNIHTPSTSTTAERSISLADLLTNYNINVNRLNQSEYWNLNTLTKLPLSSAKESLITWELRNQDGVQVNQFLSEDISSLNTNTTTISNNASSVFPAIVTTGSVDQTIDSLAWTSSDYEGVLTENVNFASLNNVLYIANGIDNLMKYDGANLYRAGLPNCKAEDFSLHSSALLVNDPADSYLHDVHPGQIEYFTFDDSVYDNQNGLDENLVVDRKYTIEFRNYNGTPQYRMAQISITSTGTGSFGSWTSLASRGSTSVINGTGFKVEVTTDGLGYIKDYYQVEAGTGFIGQDDNGVSPNFIEITKSIFTSVTADNDVTYGRLDIVDVSSQLRDKTYEYRFAFEYTDFKGNIVRSQPTESKKLVVPSNKKVVVTCPTSLSSLNDFDTTSLFDSAWTNSTGVTLDAEPTDYERAELLKKFQDQTRMRILIYRTKGYYPTKGEVAGQFYQIADIEYGTASFTDFYHDEPNDANAATQYDLVLNPFLAFAEPIKRKDPPPKGKYLTVFKNCLVIAGQNDNVNNVSYSLPKNFITGEIGSEYFPDDDNALVVESPFGSKITAIAALKDLMFVFHRDSIFAVSGNINQLELPTVDLMTKEGGVGCTSQASIEEFNGGLSFVSDTGVYTVSNRGLEEISDLIKPLFLDSNFVKEKAISFNWTDKNLLMICIPDYVIQGDSNYDPANDTETSYISKDSLIIAYDYFRQAWLRWDTLEFTDGIALLNNTVNFARNTNVGSFTATISNNGDADDYSDNGQPIQFVYETNWESLGDPTVPKKFLRIKVHSFNTDKSFESNGFLLEAGIQKNYYNVNDGKIDFDFGETADGGWGNFKWGDSTWGSLPSTFLKSKLPTGKATSLKIRFANGENNENVLITNYELEIAAPYRQEIK